MDNLQTLFPTLDNSKPIIIAGPCSAETEEQVMTTARQLAENGVKIYRAGIWKPRTPVALKVSARKVSNGSPGSRPRPA